ncbi:flagellar hook-associated protein FlgK [Geobacter sp. FeAm09]|uniref:flagellar hook-associated protein FlgK n=1 Tax=Geobacter sp. FeAm09 TaxID=2597769 RepID=UPI0011ECCD50|nr:flagellar hook-associated protein FlgK [Geobacter sp. FeAm09]QEM69862.1 flagellar hook-associated protein FlgK [Geobacter sp. FeAm09]
MSLNSIMQIGKSGLNAYQIATEVTGENIANVNTPGYSRQRAVLETAPQTMSNGFSIGTGVNITTVERYYDSLLQQQMVTGQTTLGYDTTKSTVLQQIEPSFNEVKNDGLGDAISKFFGAWQDLTLNPGGTAERQAVLTRAQILVDDFHAVSKTLNDTITTQNTSLVSMTDSINATLKDIAQLNSQIKTTQLVSGNANELKDQRDLLVQNLSKQIGITYTENSDGTTDIKFADGGAALVTGQQAGAFSLTTNAATGLYDVNLTPAGGAAAAAVTPTQGALGATLALRDTIIPGYLSQVDALASTIASKVNAQQAAGFDISGPPGAAGIAMFSPAASAATIAINPALTSTDQIAASGSATLSGDNSNAVAMAALLNDTSTMGGSTFTGYYNSLASKVGLDVQSSQNTVAQDEAFSNQLSTLRESNSGVSLDEELTNLVKYQRSYQASSKIITTATDMMDTVIGLIR